MKIKNVIPLLVIIGLTIALFVQRGCYVQREAKLQNNIDSISLSKQKLDSFYNLRGQKIYEQEAIITSNQEALRNLANEKLALQNKLEKKIKDITFYYNAKLKAKVDSVFIPYIDSTNKADTIKDCDSLKKFVRDSTVTVPKKLSLDTSSVHYKNGLRVDATVQKRGLLIDSVQILDEQTISLDAMKRNFWQSITFQRRKYKVFVAHTSPYIYVTKQNSIISDPKRKPNILLKAVTAGGLIYLGTRL